MHEDNRVEGNRIAGLAQDVADQYRLLTTERIELFRDKEHLRWGEDWKHRIDEVLAAVGAATDHQEDDDKPARWGSDADGPGEAG